MWFAIGSLMQQGCGKPLIRIETNLKKHIPR